MAGGGGTGVRPVQIDGLDITFIVGYFVLIMAIGIWSMVGVKRGSEEGYFLAGRFMTWLPVGASLFATNIGSEHYVGLSGSGAQAGIGIAAFEFNALFLLPLLGWVFIPVFIASGVSTLPEYMTKRFGGNRIRIYLAIISLILYIITKNSVDMYSGALFIQQAIGWNLYLAVFVLLGMTVLSTLTGGLAAVIYTDTVQCFIMIAGGLLLFIVGIIRVGGFEGLYYKYPRAVSNVTKFRLLAGESPSCGVPPTNSWQMLREPLDDEMPWAGFIFGQTTSSLWYWCADQMMVQRVLAAKNLSHAQGGCIFCGWIKLLPLFAMVMPGMISRVLYPEDIACATQEKCQQVCESKFSCSNIAYPKLVLGVLPAGLRGFIIAMMLSATMSDLSSTFNSASTLFVMDVYKHIRKSASVKELMIVGRIAVVVVVALGIGTIPLVQQAQGDQLFQYIQSLTNMFSPQIAAVYLVAIVWPRCTEQGAFWGLTAGFLAGLTRMILDLFNLSPGCGEEDNRMAIVKNLHYMYFALMVFWLVVIVAVVVSLLTKPLPEERCVRTLFWTRHDRTIRSDELPAPRDPSEKKVEIKDPEPDQVTVKNKGVVRRAWDWFCGVEDTEEVVDLSPEEEIQQLMQITSLKQGTKAKVFLSANAIFLMSIGLFFYIFFTVGFDNVKNPLYYKFYKG